MKITTSKRLDPRLRRLVHSTDNPGRLRGDLARSFVNATVPVGDDQPEVGADVLTKRVLIRLSRDDIPSVMNSEYDAVQVAPRVYALDVPVTQFDALAGEDAVEYVESGRQFYPMLMSSVPETRADLVVNPTGGQTPFTGQDVLVGIIDFGFDFSLDDFRHGDGTTRVEYLWDQGLTPQGVEQSPQPYNYGVEYDRAAIDTALNNPDPFATVRHIPDAGSHGTHVAGIAVGNGRSGDTNFPAGSYVGAAPEATIVFVQPAPGSGIGTFTDSVHVAEAIRYCFDKADELNLPCVINMSLGQNGGSHDGESIVEQAIDLQLLQPGRAMVLAAGNEHIWRGHSSGTLSAGQQQVLRWKMGGGLPLPQGGAIPPGFGDFTPNEMEIWYSSRDELRVRVVDPNGDASPWTAVGETLIHTFPSGDEGFIDSERFTVLNGDARIYIEVSPAMVGQTIQSGEWHVEIDAVEVVAGSFDAWIERDARRPTNNFGDQSFFIGTDFSGHSTLGTPATTRRGIAVANYEHLAEVPNITSSRGRTRDERAKPELAAPGTDIFSSNALGGRPDPNTGQPRPMRIDMGGTSMAAPHVAGIVALMLQREPRLTTEQTKKMLIASARAPIGVTPFDNAWGYGKVDARRAVDLIG